METLKQEDYPVYPSLRAYEGIPVAQAERYADELHQLHLGKSLLEICESLYIDVRIVERGNDRLAALLVPISDIGPYAGKFNFRITINKTDENGNMFQTTAKKYFENTFTIEDYYNFAIGHELGHTFFYSWDPSRVAPPKRYVPNRWGANLTEEDWCDEFSLQLMRRVL